MKSNNKIINSLLVSASLLVLATSSPAKADAFNDLLTKGKVFGEARYRIEKVEQAGLVNESLARTVRASVGYETGTWQGFKGLAELQSVQHAGTTRFNDSVNGKATYPAITDPENNEVNQAWISFTGMPKTTLKVGRQVVNLDNQRFIGSVNWRQNDQTFDAATAGFAPTEKTNLMYGYV